MKKVVACFDFDGTLTKGDSLYRFLWYYLPFNLIIQNSLQVFLLGFKYFIGLMDNNLAKEALLKRPFARVSKEYFALKAKVFSKSILPSLIKPDSFERFKWQKKRRHDCIIISASIEDYLKPWAKRVGFSEVLGTRLEIDKNGFLTGKFDGKNCYGHEKVLRLTEYLGSLDDYEIYAYGDSAGDKELLEIADHPFYQSVDTEKKLFHH